MRTLLDALDSLGAAITGDAVVEILARSRLDIDDVAPYITRQPDT